MSQTNEPNHHLLASWSQQRSGNELWSPSIPYTLRLRETRKNTWSWSLCSQGLPSEVMSYNKKWSLTILLLFAHAGPFLVSVLTPTEKKLLFKIVWEKFAAFHLRWVDVQENANFERFSKQSCLIEFQCRTIKNEVFERFSKQSCFYLRMLDPSWYLFWHPQKKTFL